MKVCVISAYPPEKGNLAEYGYYLTQELAKSKKISKIIILASKGFNVKNKENDKIKIVRCWKRNSILLFIQILKKIRKFDPDLVFFNCHMMSWGRSRIVNFFGALLPALVKKILNYKVVITLHNIVEATDLRELGINPSKINLLGSYLATKSLLSADKVVVTLRSFVSLLSKKYRKTNILYIPHGTLGRKIRSAKTTKEKVIMSFGFWRESKNLPFLIEVFKELYKKDKNLKLVIAGTSHPNFPGYLEKIKKKYKKVKNLFFTGYVPEKNLDKIFLSSTLIVLPYKTATGSSGVVHIAASYGKPVIITDLPETREIIKDEKIPLILVPKNDKEALKRAIQAVINNKKFQRFIGNESLRAAERLSFSNISKKYIKLFESIVEERKC